MTAGPNPKFAPGAGMTPPVLAGREREKAVIIEALEDLGEGCNPTANIALIGPRGNGKTALLRWVGAHVDHYGGKIKCVILNPDSFSSHSDLVDALADQGRFTTFVSNVYSASINLLGSGISLSQQASPKKLLGPVLEKKCSNSGLALLVDEAHTLYHNPEVARAFFNDAQALAGEGRPLLLILAGTPDTSSRLNGIEATFWNRLEKIGIGLLDMAASRSGGARSGRPWSGWATASMRMRWTRRPMRRSAIPISFRLSAKNCIGPPRLNRTSLSKATESAAKSWSRH